MTTTKATRGTHGSWLHLRHGGTGRVAAALALSVLVLGCGGEESVSPSTVVVTESTRASALSFAAGDLQSVNGTYGAGCTDRSGGWSLLIQDEAALVYPALSVVKGNTECVLTMTSIVGTEEYEATPPLALADAFKATASAFGTATEPVLFYGNGHLSASTFTADFVVHILYSSTSNPGTGENGAQYAVQSGSVAAESVPAPDYTIDMDAMLVETNNSKIVETATGTANLFDGTVTGQSWVIVTSLPATPDYSDVDDAFKAGSATEFAPGADPTIPAAAFGIIGEDLTLSTVRYLIISNTVNSVSSYEVLTITFNGPA